MISSVNTNFVSFNSNHIPKLKQLLFFGLVFMVCLTKISFCNTDFSKVDSLSKNIPDTLITVKSIAHYLTKDLNTETEKIRAIYIWVTHNITYDLEYLANRPLEKSKEKMVIDVLQKRKGVCSHYAFLFQYLCRAVNLECQTITGYTRDSNGDLSFEGHAWNAVKADTTYHLIDATWAAGYLMDNQYHHELQDEYFMIAPKEMIKTHFPVDPIWQLINNPLTYSEFENQNFVKLSEKGNWNYSDSINQFIQLSSRDSLNTLKRRISHYGLGCPVIQKDLNHIDLNLSVIELNTAIAQYNLFINYRYKMFKNPKITDDEIKNLVEGMWQGIYISKRILDHLQTDYEVHQYHVEENKKLVDELIPKIENEKELAEKYLKVWKPFRPFFLSIKNSYISVNQPTGNPFE